MKILLIRFSSIGDIVLTSPIQRALRQQTQAEIHFLTKKAFADIVTNSPYLSKVHLLDDDINALIASLKSEKFDLIIDLHKNLRSARIRKSLSAKSVTFDKINLQKWLAVYINKKYLPQKHIVDRYFESLLELGVINDGVGLEYFLPQDYSLSERASQKLTGWLNTDDTPYILIAPHAAHATKSMPEDLLRAILSGISTPVIIAGGPPDKDYFDGIAREYDHVINLAGSSTLHDSAFLIKNAVLTITADTGMMHVSAAFKKPNISIWGNTIPEFGMYPYYGSSQVQHHISQVDDLRCRPCSKIGHKQCPKGHFKCMKEQNVSEIIEKVAEYIDI